MSAGIGHNSGRVDAPGQSWRRYAWAKARRDLLPTLPIEVVRLRVKRAQELGLPYKTYAGIRASNGHDLVGFLFSSNALRVLRDGDVMPDDRVAILQGLKHCRKIGFAHAPVTPQGLTPPMDQAFSAPVFGATWSATRSHLRQAIQITGQPADRYVLIGDTALEREWAEAAQIAGYLTSAQFFHASAP